MSHEALLRTLGVTIRHQRKVRGWTQEHLAERARLSTYFVGAVERGQATLSLRSLQQLAGALAVSLASLFEPARDEHVEQLRDQLAARVRHASAEELRALLGVAALIVRRRPERTPATAAGPPSSSGQSRSRRTTPQGS